MGQLVTERASDLRYRVGRVLVTMKDIGRRRMPFLHPVWMLAKRALFRLQFRTTETRFREVFRGNHWRNPETVSGFGSSIEATAAVRNGVAEITQRYAITSLLDVPCGDFNWMQHVEFAGSYCGGDIVSDLIARNDVRYGNERRKFIVLDVIKDPLPRSDLILCRDGLNHLSLPEAVRALGNILSSGSSYLAVTHDPTAIVNRRQASGFDYRPLNLLRPPFNWPPPIEIWEESAEPGKTLALWRLDSVRTSSADGTQHRQANAPR
jgi:SAM-dependent methyltransferase